MKKHSWLGRPLGMHFWNHTQYWIIASQVGGRRFCTIVTV